MAVTVLTDTLQPWTYSGGGAEDQATPTTAGNVPANSYLFLFTSGWQGASPDPYALVKVNTAAAEAGTPYDLDASLSGHDVGDGVPHVVSIHRYGPTGAGAPEQAFITPTTEGNAGVWGGVLVAVSGLKLASSPLVGTPLADGDPAEDPSIGPATATAGQLQFAIMFPVDYNSAVVTPSGWNLLASKTTSEPYNIVWRITAGDNTAQWGRSSTPAFQALMLLATYDLEGDPPEPSSNASLTLLGIG